MSKCLSHIKNTNSYISPGAVLDNKYLSCKHTNHAGNQRNTLDNAWHNGNDNNAHKGQSLSRDPGGSGSVGKYDMSHN